jgi:hypothetical protein
MRVPSQSGARADIERKNSDLSPARQRLVELIRFVHFGRIENLTVRAGEPVFDPPPLVIRTVKIAGHSEPRPQTAAEDFVLRREVSELLEHLQRLGNGIVNRIEIAHGIPLHLEVQENPAA